MLWVGSGSVMSLAWQVVHIYYMNNNEGASFMVKKKLASCC